ncbi:MAG: hypothetical protein PVH54_08485 [Gammaproteobacteria bacterium]|jgi:hypothetical protein
MKAFLKWLLGVVSVLLGIAGLYWLAIILGWALGTSGTEGLFSRYGGYLVMIGLPAALLAAVLNRPLIGAHILGITFLLLLLPAIYLWVTDYIAHKDERMDSMMKARANIEKNSVTRVSCNGYTLHFTESRWGTAVVLLEPVDERNRPVFLATYNIHQSRKSCELHTRPGEIGTAREITGQCGDTAQKELQLMLERLEQTTCPYMEDVL